MNAGDWDIFWPQFLRGQALAPLFIPLTTITMDPIPKEERGNATSILFNLMRNIGGSIGIASATTLLARHTQANINVLGAHIPPPQPADAGHDRWDALRADGRQGDDSFTVSKRSYASLFGIVVQQADMMSFLEIFQIFGIIFLLVLPLPIMLKRPTHRADEVAMPSEHRPA